MGRAEKIRYRKSMSSFFLILMGIAMLGVVGILFLGLFSMAKGGEFNAKYGNKLMQARVWMQGIAIVCFILAAISRSVK